MGPLAEDHGLQVSEEKDLTSGVSEEKEITSGVGEEDLTSGVGKEKDLTPGVTKRRTSIQESLREGPHFRSR